MVKAVSFFKRKPGMAVEAFQAYWRTAHPDVVVKLPGVRRYVQSHTLLSGYRKREPVARKTVLGRGERGRGQRSYRTRAGGGHHLLIP